MSTLCDEYPVDCWRQRSNSERTESKPKSEMFKFKPTDEKMYVV